jgi:copper(I)-binding protein
MKKRYVTPMALTWMAAGLATTLALGGCNKQPAAQPAVLPSTQPGVLITGGRLVLPAVPGRPAAAYFTLTNEANEGVVIAAVKIDSAAKAEMHETSGTSMAPLPSLALGAGQSVLFAPAGKHVMVFDLAPKIAAGKLVDITLSTKDGKKITGQLVAEPAGGAAAAPAMDHAGMKM